MASRRLNDLTQRLLVDRVIMPVNSEAAKVLTAIIRRRETAIFYGVKEDRKSVTDESMALRREYSLLRTSMPTKGASYLARLSDLEALRDQIIALEGIIPENGFRGIFDSIAKNMSLLKVSA